MSGSVAACTTPLVAVMAYASTCGPTTLPGAAQPTYASGSSGTCGALQATIYQVGAPYTGSVYSSLTGTCTQAAPSILQACHFYAQGPVVPPTDFVAFTRQ